MSNFHDAEWRPIIDALKAASGKVAGAGGAAEQVGLKRTTLQNKIRRAPHLAGRLLAVTDSYTRRKLTR